MILYKKKHNQDNILGYKYIYEDKDNYVFIDFGRSMITNLYVYEKSSLTKIDDIDYRTALNECYYIIHYGKLKFRMGQTSLEENK
tara:strand:+ start:210 stop:464 length:255 start_codon:yes stop_codon:yes gene_type:complete